MNFESNTAKRKPTVRAATPAVLADVALIDGPTAAAAACISLSQWHELVKTGAAPQPVVREPRFTRYRLADVKEWLVERASTGTAAGRTVAQAKRASSAAKTKRQVSPQAGA